jgi:Fe-S-cluster containining protein
MQVRKTKPNHGGGRPPMMFKCKLCGAKLNKTEMRLHEPGCRRATLLHVGARFTVMLNDRQVPVIIEEFLTDEGEAMRCRNLISGRRIRVTSPRRFREWMESANVRFVRAG